MKYCLLSIIWWWTSAPILVAQSAKIDVRVVEYLQKLSYQYNIKPEDGSFQLVIPLTNERTQLVVIQSRTGQYDRLEIREVYSVIYEATREPSAEQMRRLLLDNTHKKLGAWELAQEQGKYYLLFTAKVPAVITAEELRAVLNIVASSADAMESALFERDEW